MKRYEVTIHATKEVEARDEDEARRLAIEDLFDDDMDVELIEGEDEEADAETEEE